MNVNDDSYAIVNGQRVDLPDPTWWATLVHLLTLAYAVAEIL